MLTRHDYSIAAAIVTVGLSMLFLIAGAAKILTIDRWRLSLREFTPRVLWRPFFVWLVPITELWIAGTLLVPRWSDFASVMAASTLAMFTASLFPSLMRGRAPECYCFGLAKISRISWWTVLRNGVIVCLALVVHFAPPAGVTFGWFEAVDSESGANVGTFLIASFGAIAGVTLVVTLLRGDESFRADQTKGGGRDSTLSRPVPVDSESLGVPIGTSVPMLNILSCCDGTTDFESVARQNGGVMVVFTSANCSVCQGLLIELAELVSKGGRRCLAVVSIGSGSLSKHEKPLGIDNFCEGTREVMRALNLSIVPSGIVFGSDSRVASRVAVGPEEVRVLAQECIQESP